MTSDQDQTFHTGIDAVTMTILTVSIAPVLVFAIVEPKARTPVMYITTALVVLLFWYLYRTTYYVLQETQLVVRCGPIRVDVPYESLRRASFSGSLMSGYAMSLKRISIEYGTYDTMLISPADRDAFLDALHELAPHAEIRRDGDG